MTWTLNDKEVFTTGDQDPAFSFSVNELTDPSKVSGTKSNTIRLANTKGLRQLVDSEMMNTAPRADRPILEHGRGSGSVFRQEVLPIRIDRNEAQMIAVGGNAAWFDWARKTKLNEMDLGFSEPVTKTYQRDGWEDETRLVNFPIVDFGSLEARAATYDVTVDKLRPAYRIGNLLETVFSEIGYHVVPRGRLVRHWNKLGLLAPSDSVKSRPDASSPLRSDPVPYGGGFPSNPIQTAPVTSTPAFMAFDNGGTTGPGYFDDTILTASQRYEPTSNTLLSVEIVDFEIVTWNAAMEGARVAFVLWEKTQGIPLGVFWSEPLISAPGFPGTPLTPILVSGTYETSLVEAGKQVTIGLWNDQGLSGVNATANVNSSTSGKAHFVPLTMPYAEDLPLYLNSALPKWSVMDLVKAMLAARFLVLDTPVGGNTINVFYFDDYFGTPAPGVTTRDWTGRIDHTTAPAKVIDDAPIRIQYEFAEDKGDVTVKGVNALLPAPGYGNGIVEVGGYGQEQTVKVPFAASAMGFILDGLRVPIMRDKDADYQEDKYDREVRLLIFDGVADGAWKHAGDSLTEYPKTYFNWPGDRSIPVGFDNNVVFGDERASGSIFDNGRKKHAILQSPALEAFLVLRNHEVQDFNHGVPTLVDDSSGPAWYYAHEIKHYEPGKNLPAKCLLVRIPGTTIDPVSTTPDNGGIEYPELIVNPAFVPPCTNAPRFPTPPVLVSYRVSASSQAAVEADPTSYPVGMRFAIACLSGGGSANWDAWVGDVVQRVAPGTGTSGSAWQRLNLAPGRIVENVDFAASTEWDRYLIATPYGMTYYMYAVSAMDTSGNWTFIDMYDPCGAIISPYFDYANDACRRFQIQANTTTDQSAGWVDVGDELPFIYGSETVPLPPGALYARVKYMRGPNLQGYSDRTLIV